MLDIFGNRIVRQLFLMPESLLEGEIFLLSNLSKGLSVIFFNISIVFNRRVRTGKMRGVARVRTKERTLVRD